MTQEEFNQLGMALAEDLELGIDVTDEEEIDELLEDMLEGYRPVELSTDEYSVWMVGKNGAFILEYMPKKHSIQAMVSRGLITPSSWQLKTVAGLFDKRFYYLTEKGSRLATSLQLSPCTIEEVA
jgi:hypothetical protein